MPSFRDKKTNRKKVGEIRKSKIAGNSGCGALVEFPGFSGIMGGQNLWDMYGTNHMKVHERQLELILKKDFFLQVSSDETAKFMGNRPYQIPVLRFPDYYYCPSCHELDFARRLAKNYGSDRNNIEPLKCSKCGDTELIPSRFVLACENGHIDDFPYSWWVHKGSEEECSKPRLTLSYIGKTGGLDSILIKCENCGKSQNMANVLNKEATISLKCNGKRPWLGHNNTCECGKPVRALLRGASNIYFPEKVSALTIPPWSTNIQKAVDENYDTLKAYFVPEFTDEMKELGVKSFYKSREIGKIYDCSEDEFLEQVKLRFFTGPEEEVSIKTIQLDEYKAFTGKDINDFYFKSEEAEIINELKPYFNSVKLIKRLREVQVLKSFRRMSAYAEEGGISAPLSSRPENWLPAAELLGEGIFIEFNKEKLHQWVKHVENRYETMHKRYNNKKLALLYGSFCPELVLIHTFSHLLMKELAYTCGYDASSLSEKLYVSNDDNSWMAGVLIYTASSASDGSLGGLVRQGSPRRLYDTILSMIDRAIWCSNDPICIEAQSQGDSALNYAACHACSLAPEISCRMNNTVLDRTSIVGNYEDRTLGYFGDIVESL